MSLRQRCAVAVVACCLAGGTLAEAQQPPRDLHLVGDHWTAWDPPTSFPEGTQVHVIERGDTLWALAGRFYGDPYLWPQLWERNQYIRDAHWIYPGDPLVVSVEVVPVDELVEVDLGDDVVEPPVEEEPGLNLAREAVPPQALGSQDDIYCSGYVGDRGEEFGYQIIGSEYQAQSPTLAGTAIAGAGTRGIYGDVDAVRYNLTLGDLVYVDGGLAAGLTPGLVYTVVEPREIVAHPLTGEEVGQLYEYRGRVRLLTVLDDLAIAEISDVCGPILVPSALKPFVPEPVPLGRRTGMRAPNVPAPASTLEGAPVILRGKHGVVNLGDDHVVFIDSGEDVGLAPGDLLTIYRMNKDGFPPVVVGEVAVLTVQERTAVGKILEARFSAYAGDRLGPK
ncbi:MAG TPA: LysM peptidoglycan-binding domain-containing protein [Thermoanaerobaculia bacterium]|nr:LysM peptidoglycan-binding domain-containing protein [Thermoanaerobaculia bacterium]